MRHITDGTLRRLVDDPAGVTDDDRSHVAACQRCHGGLTAARGDAQLVGAALATPPADVSGIDLDRAWARFSASDEASTTAYSAQRRRSWSTPVAASVGAAVLLAGGGAAAATNWLEIFRTEKVSAVSISEKDLVGLPDLDDYGDVDVTKEPRFRSVKDTQAAAAATGLVAPEVRELPQGVSGAASYTVTGRVEATYTFSESEAAQAAEAQGEALPAPPDGMDGSEFRFVAGPGLAAMWDSDTGLPGLVVARAVAPTAFSSGLDFETARDYLLTMPGLPDDVADQLSGFSADATTLPLPLPKGEVDSSTAEVDGVEATTFTSQEGTMAGVVWVEDGIITVVGGSMEVDELLEVARGLEG